MSKRGKGVSTMAKPTVRRGKDDPGRRTRDLLVEEMPRLRRYLRHW